jgi:hypothetical protein
MTYYAEILFFNMHYFYFIPSSISKLAGKFDPSLAGTGLKMIHYSYGIVTACSSAIYKSILVEECNKTKTFEGVDYAVYPNPASGSFKLFYQSEVFNSFNWSMIKGDCCYIKI